MGTRKVRDPFYGDEERYDEPRAVVAETDEQAGLPTQPLIRPQVFDVEPNTAERRIETMAEKIAFKVKVHPQTDPENPPRLYRIRVFEFHAESWEEALAYAREKGEPLSIALAKVE